MTLSRRELFGMFRRSPDREPAGPALVPPAAGPALAAPAGTDAATGDIPAAVATSPAFSLDAFYAGRTADRTLPAFAIRATAATTTRIGSGPALPTSPLAPAATPPMPAATPPIAATAAVTTPVAPDRVPEVLPHRCLATRSFCSTCIEHCPVPGAIVASHGRPRVVADLCNGCGRCIATCPAPILAFALVARSKDPA